MLFVDTESECVGRGHGGEAAELVPTSDDEHMIDDSCDVGIGEFRGGSFRGCVTMTSALAIGLREAPERVEPSRAKPRES